MVARGMHNSFQFKKKRVVFLFFRVSVSHLGRIGPLAFLKVNWISFTPSGQSYSPVMCISPNPGCSGSASYPLSPHSFLLKRKKK